MSLKDITITGSIGSIATQSYGQKTYISSTDDQSFPLEHVTGSYAGSWPNFPLRGLNTSNSASNTTVGLVVNVTQSWPGSNTTPLGIVPYVHNTMEEFINGEFSGSSYVVTDGSLTDAQCEQFLTVNTTPVNYNVFSFYKNSTQDPANVYLNRNTAPLNGQIYIYYYNYSGGNTYGVYAKIARIDALGHDNTLSLQELKQFRYTDSSTSEKIIFDVININEYPDYYFYEVVSNTTLAVPSFGNVVNHSLSARYTSSILPTSGFFYFFPSSSGNWSKTIDNLNYFNDYNSGIYIFGDTPNTELQYTASFKFTTTQNNQSVGYAIINTSNPSDLIYSIVNASIIYLETPFTISSAGTTYTLDKKISGFFQNIKTYGSALLYYSNYPLNNVTASLIITQSVAAQQSTSSFTISPYLLSTFTNSDCDVLMNNADLNDVSTFYREVLYENGGTTPSNLQQIISGTAEYAQINDYLYNANANVLPRYQGVRTTSAGVNLPSINGLSNEELSTITSTTLRSDPSNTIASVQNLKTSIAYSEKVIDSAPIVMNSSRAIIKFLIDENGKALNPNVDKDTIYITQGNFMSEENLIINTVQESLYTGNTTISSKYKPIIRGGYRPVPILYNQIQDPTHPPMTWANYISFTDDSPESTVTVKDFTATLSTNNNFTVLNGSGDSTGIYNNYIISKGVDITSELNTSNSYVITQNVIDEQVDLVFDCLMMLRGGLSAPADVTIYLIRERGANLDRYYKQGPTINIHNSFDRFLSLYVTIPKYDLQLNDRFQIGLQVDNGRSIFYNSQYWKITTIPLPTPTISSSGLFNITSSLPPNVPGNHYNYIYTTSSALLQYFNNSLVHQSSISNSLFETSYLPFTLKTGDQFRFEGDERKVFEVKSYTQITSSNGTGSLFIELTKQISGSGCNLDKFLLRRYIPDAQSIVFENTLDKEAAGVILTPEYISSKLKDNINTYVTNLTKDSLI